MTIDERSGRDGQGQVPRSTRVGDSADKDKDTQASKTTRAPDTLVMPAFLLARCHGASSRLPAAAPMICEAVGDSGHSDTLRRLIVTPGDVRSGLTS